MFKKIRRLFKSKNEDSKSFKRGMAKHLDSRIIKYSTERIDNTENVIGREGSISVRNDQLIVLSGGKIIMRANIDEMKASELLSLEGVIITAPDLERNGEVHTIVAYYKYYR